jgi:hypothetical protein
MNLADPLRIERQEAVEATLIQPEFAALRHIGIEAAGASATGPFSLSDSGAVQLAPAAFTVPALLGFYLRHGLELAWLRKACGASGAVGLAAARAAALFVLAEFDALTAAERAALPFWAGPMASEVAPASQLLERISAALPGAPAAPDEIARIRSIWSQLGTADALMETGGDIRLQRDPRSALNGYGCSHRPRPWAVTFASSTASSSSERGYLAADLERLRTTAGLLMQDGSPVRDSLDAVRSGIAAFYALPPDNAVVLAASGTDTELLALALTHLGGADRPETAAPILNILIAPEETGRGVPMAARGVHFAVDTALGHAVSFEAPIAGFRPDTELANVALRDAKGVERSIDAVEAELAEITAAGIAAGKRVILHVLDLSKTGLLAPRPACLAALRARHGAAFDIVVDACQARLSGRSVLAYLQLDAVVLVTGSKFFTGPPFAGALLLPNALARRLEHSCLPEGLDAYFGRDEFPANCKAAAALPACGNYGLALRWHAALAEMRAFAAVSPRRRAETLAGFAAVVQDAIAANPMLTLLEAPSIARSPADESWERLPSIFTFSLRAPHAPGRCLTPIEARSVYLWLNADLSEIIPGHPAASRICHIGQPVRLPQPGAARRGSESFMGVLRVSAGARLISGEPSHEGLAYPLRIAREFADLEMVFDKIALILDHWQLLRLADPAPRYRATRRQTTALN